MKFRVGDKVRFLNDVGGGTITRIEKTLVYVMGSDGFELPVPHAELIVVSSKADASLDQMIKNEHSEQTEPSPQSFSNPAVQAEEDLDPGLMNFVDLAEDEEDDRGEFLGLFFGFVPVKENSDQHLYLINDSAYRVLYTLSHWTDESSLIPFSAGFLYPDSKEHITTLSKEDINSGMTLNLQCIFFKNRAFIPQQPEYFDYQINPTKFYKKGIFVENDFFDENALIVSVIDSKKEAVLESLTRKAVEDSILSKDMPKRQDMHQKDSTPSIEEVDLHIGELIDHAEKLKAGEIIEIQMGRFKIALEGAIKSKAKKIVFIHGVGNGKLKHELKKELDKNYPKLRYQDASFREYGYGATMVFLP